MSHFLELLFRSGRLSGHPGVDPDFLLELTSRTRPFWVCTSCKTFGGPGICLYCTSGVDVYEIASDEDLHMVLASLS